MGTIHNIHHGSSASRAMLDAKNYESFRTGIDKFLADHGLFRTDLARVCSMDVSMLNKVLGGKQMPRKETMDRIESGIKGLAANPPKKSNKQNLVRKKKLAEGAELMRRIIDRVKAYLREHDMPDAQFALDIGMSSSGLSKLLNGTPCEAQLVNALSMARVMGVSIYDLIGEEEPARGQLTAKTPSETTTAGADPLEARVLAGETALRTMSEHIAEMRQEMQRRAEEAENRYRQIAETQERTTKKHFSHIQTVLKGVEAIPGVCKRLERLEATSQADHKKPTEQRLPI